jgi:hypothetical protein
MDVSDSRDVSWIHYLDTDIYRGDSEISLAVASPESTCALLVIPPENPWHFSSGTCNEKRDGPRVRLPRFVIAVLLQEGATKSIWLQRGTSLEGRRRLSRLY